MNNKYLSLTHAHTDPSIRKTRSLVFSLPAVFTICSTLSSSYLFNRSYTAAATAVATAGGGNSDDDGCVHITPVYYKILSS